MDQNENKRQLKLGSLFDGSGGFPLAGSLCGIKPCWAAEVEPYCIAVTRSRFPDMKHLGSVTEIHGGEIEPVDIITFGSPCQDLSVAGKRAGLKHEANGDEETTRSGLFMEAVRIIKEMREATNGLYPRIALWENVPGAFSSNRGEDFRVVLEELIKVVEPSAVMPEVPKNGWPYSDCYSGDGWSIAYRTLDAQYWGVPQRRRRIYLVADFRGGRAGQISFERKGLRGDFAKGGASRKDSAGDAEDSSGADDPDGDRGNCLTPWDVQSRRIFTVDGPWPALYGGEGGGHGYAAVPCYDLGEARLRTPNEYVDRCPTLTARCGTGGNNVPGIVEPITFEPGIARREGGHIYEGVAGTLRANAGDNQLAVAQPIAVATQQGGAEISENGICPTITAAAGMSGNNQPWICKPIAVSSKQQSLVASEDLANTLGANDFKEPQVVCHAVSDEPVAFHLLQDPISSENVTPCLGTGSNHGQASVGVCYGDVADKHILDDQGGSQISVRTDGKSPTLRAEMHGNVPCVMEAMGFDMYNQQSTGDVSRTLKTPVGGDDLPVVCIKDVLPFDTTQVTSPQNGNNPKWGDPCHPLAAQGHPPTVICKTWDARGNGDGETVSTITGDHENRITDYTSVVVEEVPVICLQGNGIDRADTAGCNGKGWREDVSYTLNTIDRPAVVYAEPVCVADHPTPKVDTKGTAFTLNSRDYKAPLCAVYAMQGFGDYKTSDVSSGMKARDWKDATDLVVESYGVDCRNMNEYPELYPTLQAKPNGGQSLNFSGALRTTIPGEKGASEPMVRYIVRRLTPTECARLQGFPDKWGHPDVKEDFTEEEYRFWLDVRNTHAAINGKPEKDYTKEQMLTWYNKLHTDSSEYKMWGNGIALPTALYMMQGIADALNADEGGVNHETGVCSATG